jgi:lysophospholipase L1-like esterase
MFERTKDENLSQERCNLLLGVAGFLRRMKTILCFGDSNTWGYRPDGTGRFEWEERWPGVLQRQLSGFARVIEEGLNARTTVFDDPIEGVSVCRNGSRHLPILLETHRPIDLVIIFLGVNDLKRRFDATPFDIAQAAGELVGMVKRSVAGPEGQSPKILLICPPPVKVLNVFAGLFEGAIAKSSGLAARYAWQAGRSGCCFLDAGEVVTLSPVDGIHLDAEGHRLLAVKVAEVARSILGS